MLDGLQRASLDLGDALDGLQTAPLVGQVEGFEDVRERRVVPADAFDGRLQVQEALALQHISRT